MRNLLFFLFFLGCSQESMTEENVKCTFLVHDGFMATETCTDHSTSECAVVSYCGDTSEVYDTNCSAEYVRTVVACESGNEYEWNTLIPKR